MDIDDTQPKMQTALQAIQNDINSIRVGRATPALVDDITVAAYGGTQQLKVMEMASITAQDNQTLVINPWDKTVIGEIAKAINSSDLGVTAVIDGEVIRIQIPPVTEQRRQELIKILHTKMEEGKVQLRQIRHDKLNDIKKAHEDKEINDDDKFNLEKELQKIMDDFVKQVDDLGEKKETELKSI